jgi:NAD(P)-dependent dehydrogenase (short-subunit alcohol dehydrogenase family)
VKTTAHSKRESRASIRLTGKVVVITGASRGLGRALAIHFARAGASLALGARTISALHALGSTLRQKFRIAPSKILVAPLDVSKEVSVRRFASMVRKRFGRVDVLVNCAGVPGPRGALDQADWSEWKQAVQVNLLGLAYVTRCLLPLMRGQQGGKIINISGGGATKPLPHLSAYAATKAAVVRLTETLAEELRDVGIAVNAVAPGVLGTRMVEQILELGEQVLGTPYVREVKRQMRNPKPALNRAARLCLFLASSQADGITGRLISAVWDPWPDLNKCRDTLLKTDIYTLRRIEPRDRGVKWGKTT